jgi:hypothetical protein
MANIIKTLIDRYKNSKKFSKDTINEAQKIFKKVITGGKRYYEPEFGFSKENRDFDRVLKQVRSVRSGKEGEKTKK